MPMREGSHPAAAQLTNQPMGSRFSSASLSSDTTKQAAAASFCWLALPAVTTPSFSMGRSLPRLSAVASALLPSSLAKTMGSSPFFLCFTETEDEFVVELAGLTHAARRPLVALRGVFVRGLPADLIVAGQVVSRLDQSPLITPEALDTAGSSPRPRARRSVQRHQSPRGLPCACRWCSTRRCSCSSTPPAITTSWRRRSVWTIMAASITACSGLEPQRRSSPVAGDLDRQARRQRRIARDAR